MEALSINEVSSTVEDSAAAKETAAAKEAAIVGHVTNGEAAAGGRTRRMC